MDRAEVSIVKFVQSKCFTQDINYLKRNLEIPSTSPLKRLKPFMDDKGVLRVYGRLQYSELQLYINHPIILPYNHHIT